MIEILTDQEGIPLPMSLIPRKMLWELFSLSNSDESELIALLQNSIILPFDSLDSRLSELKQIKIFTSESLDYLSEIYIKSKRINRELSDTLVIEFENGLGIISIRTVDSTLEMVLAIKEESSTDCRHEIVTSIVNSLLNWLWLYMNSY